MSDVSSELATAGKRYLAMQEANRERRLVRMRAICEKVSYDNEKLARTALSTIREKSEKIWVPIRTYRCPKCSLWHLTSTPLPYTPKPWEVGN